MSTKKPQILVTRPYFFGYNGMGYEATRPRQSGAGFRFLLLTFPALQTTNFYLLEDATRKD